MAFRSRVALLQEHDKRWKKNDEAMEARTTSQGRINDEQGRERERFAELRQEIVAERAARGKRKRALAGSPARGSYERGELRSYFEAIGGELARPAAGIISRAISARSTTSIARSRQRCDFVISRSGSRADCAARRV